VSRANLQPGDLIFFFSPIHHVAIYMGNGKMIEAPHTGDVVSINPVYWSQFAGACRP
jgi:cell wall-associated NlpC family hydrolase